MPQDNDIDFFPSNSGQEVLQQLHSGDVPSTWRVFSASRNKVLILLSSFCVLTACLLGFIIVYLFINFTTFFVHLETFCMKKYSTACSLLSFSLLSWPSSLPSSRGEA